MSQVIPTFAIHFHLDMAIVDSRLCVTVQLAASVYDNKDKRCGTPLASMLEIYVYLVQHGIHVNTANAAWIWATM